MCLIVNTSMSIMEAFHGIWIWQNKKAIKQIQINILNKSFIKIVLKLINSKMYSKGSRIRMLDLTKQPRHPTTYEPKRDSIMGQLKNKQMEQAYITKTKYGIMK